MYRLLARKGAGSLAVEAMLAECQLPYTVEDLVRDEKGALPETLHRINPRAEVPTLLMPDDSVMTESAAILIHLADLVPEKGLAPAIGTPQRGPYLRWMIFLATTVYMSDLRYFYPQRYTTDQAGTAGIKAFAEAGMMREFEILSGAVGKGPYVLGTPFSAVDIYAAMLISWAPDLIQLFATHPNLKTIYDKVVERPRIAPVWRRNEV